MITTLTTSQIIFIIIGVSAAVNILCKFMFWLDTPRSRHNHTTSHHTINH